MNVYRKKGLEILTWLVHGIIIIKFYNDFVTYMNFIFITIDAMKICWKLLQCFVGLTVICVSEFLWKIQIGKFDKFNICYM